MPRGLRSPADARARPFSRTPHAPPSGGSRKTFQTGPACTPAQRMRDERGGPAKIFGPVYSKGAPTRVKLSCVRAVPESFRFWQL